MREPRHSRDGRPPPEARRSKEGFFSYGLCREHGPAVTLLLDSWPPDLEENKFPLLPATQGCGTSLRQSRGKGHPSPITPERGYLVSVISLSRPR